MWLKTKVAHVAFQLVPPTSFVCCPPKELLDTLQIAEARENRERTQRKLAWQADLPTSGRGSASHLRHSNVLDWHAPAVNAASLHGGLSRGRQHKEARQHALVFQRLRDSVRKIQDDCGSAGPVRYCSLQRHACLDIFPVNDTAGCADFLMR